MRFKLDDFFFDDDEVRRVSMRSSPTADTLQIHLKDGWELDWISLFSDGVMQEWEKLAVSDCLHDLTDALLSGRNGGKDLDEMALEHRKRRKNEVTT